LAGLVDNKRVTAHWEYHSALTEMLPDVQMQDTIYTVDGRVFTCAGGASSMDMILHRISQEYGQDLSTWVAEQMVYTAPRTHNQSQRMSMQGRAGVRHVKLSMAIDIMRNNIEDPLTPNEVAEVVGLSTRQLERLFGKYLNTSPKKYYLMLRLEKSRHLLLQTELSLTDIGVACGFKSQSHFSKSYRSHFGIKPSHETGATKPKEV
jgi:transcriptional regulator GlxA family with amidase domain